MFDKKSHFNEIRVDNDVDVDGDVDVDVDADVEAEVEVRFAPYDPNKTKLG